MILATSELLRMLEAGGLKPRTEIIYCGNILLFASAWLPMCLTRSSPTSTEIAVFLFSAFVLTAFAGEMLRYDKPGGISANIAAAVFAFAYIGLMFHFIVQLRLNWGIGALTSFVVVVKMGDIGAYAVGRLIGRHKMAPRLSPGKTLEGAAGAILFACFGAWLSFRYILPATSQTNLPSVMPGGWAIYGALIGAAGMFGDLAESLLKRDVGRKDSSDWMPGFGGILDILDSLLLAAPIAWFCWTWGIL
jgi:phosphatidate cytidylyltransferase